MKKDIELLAPAGNMDSFKAAINTGANAIYMGVNKFNARQMATNFTIEEYIECIKYAHMLDVKVYLTINTLMYDYEIEDALEIISILYKNGLDAIIVQDIGFFSLVHEIIPELPIHASTQMSVYNLEQVKYLEKMGAKRIVLARELSLEQIEYICKNTNVEIEVFVHGALCVSYSGQCLLSSTIGNRSANRGSCAQPCRMKYSLYNEKNENVVSNKYILSKKDIYSLSHIKKLIDIGVSSLKIEGRNKTPEYVAGVTKTYRKYIDKYLENKNSDVDSSDKYSLMQLFNRSGASEGYLNGVLYKDSITEMSPKNTGLYLGEVLLKKNNFVKVKLSDCISLHDGFEVIQNGDVCYSSIVTCIKDEHLNVVNKTIEKGNIVWMGDIKSKVDIGSKIYKTSSSLQNANLKKYYYDAIKRRINIDIKLSFKSNKNICACGLMQDKELIVSTSYIPQISINKSLSKEDVITAFSKTQDTPFNFNILDAEIDDNIFVPVSKLNELRRNLVLAIQNYKTNTKEIIDYNKKLEKALNIVGTYKNNNVLKNRLRIYNFKKDINYIEYYSKTYEKNLEAIYVDIGDIRKNKESIFKQFLNKVKIYIVLPNVGGENTDKYIFENLESLVKEGASGLVVGNIGYINLATKLKEKYKLELVADYHLNISNKYSAYLYKNIGFDIVVPSVELKAEQLLNLNKLFNVETVLDYIEVLTSRYCILGAYVSNRQKNKKCTMPCVKNKYYITDKYNKKYNLICNNFDCIMKIVARTYIKNENNLIERRCSNI